MTELVESFLKERRVRSHAAWLEVSRKVRARSGGRCEACDVHPLPGCSGRVEEVHHVLPRSRGGQDVAGNALGLGVVHHRWAHENPWKARALGFLA